MAYKGVQNKELLQREQHSVSEKGNSMHQQEKTGTTLVFLQFALAGQFT